MYIFKPFIMEAKGQKPTTEKFVKDSLFITSGPSDIILDVIVGNNNRIKHVGFASDNESTGLAPVRTI